MEAKETIKDAIIKKLQHLSKEELLDRIADLLLGYITVSLFAEVASMLSSSKPTADLGEIINATASKLKKQEFTDQQVCKVDDTLFKGEE